MEYIRIMRYEIAKDYVSSYVQKSLCFTMVEAQTCIKKFVKSANKHNVKILKQTKNRLLACRSASDTSVLWYFKIIKSAYIPAPPKEVKEIQTKLKDELK